MFIEKFKEGESKRMKYTVPATIFALSKLCFLIHTQKTTHEKLNFNVLFELMKKLIEGLTA
jgi:hypothetical protein